MEFFQFIFPLSKNKNKTKKGKLKYIHEFNFLDRWPWGWRWCLYLPQACVIKILLSTWSLSQEERENEESKEKLENLRYIQKDLRLCLRWVEYHSFAVFSRDWSSTCNSCLLPSNTVWMPSWYKYILCYSLKKRSVYMVEEFKILAKATLPLEKYQVPE